MPQNSLSAPQLPGYPQEPSPEALMAAAQTVLDGLLDSQKTPSSMLGLGRMRRVLALLGNPQDRLRVIHVAGTNGKGSVCAMLSHVLLSAGYTVGTYTSPHLITVRERIALNGQPVPAGDFHHDVKHLEQQLIQAGWPRDEWPTHFEFLTALAFWRFAESRVDWVVLETGLGGRLDATNVVPAPQLTIITSIGLDHTHILGDTLTAIASEKAGIFRPGVPTVLGPHLPAEALAAIQTVADSLPCPTHAACPWLGSPLATSSLETGLQVAVAERGIFTLPAAGLTGISNLATTLCAVAVLRRQGAALSEEAVRRGVASTHWPGRFGHLPEHRLIVDGSHNPDGLQVLADSLSRFTAARPLVWLLSQKTDRDAMTLVRLVQRFPETTAVICTQPVSAHAFRTPEYLAAALRAELPVPVESFADHREALNRVTGLLASSPDALGVVTGSLYTAGDVLAALDNNSLPLHSVIGH
ncbi:MAG: folylpolyglutamate synthase/dihydrofolate synthase family protein [Candidatus Melainabacteria bacterium]